MDIELLKRIVGNRIAYLRVLSAQITDFQLGDFVDGYLFSLREDLSFMESLELLLLFYEKKGTSEYGKN